MRETTPTEAQEPSGGPTSTEAWLEDLEAIGRRLHEQGLVSLEQVELLDGLARELGRLVREKPTATLPLLSVAFSAMEFERLARQQAQAAGTVARVRSAVPLTKEERAILKERLRERFGQEFLLHLEVDPSLIGGLVVEVRGQIIDGSVAGKLAALEEHLQAAFEERKLFPSKPPITESTEY
jgi:F-type H+-transporting ATPase subunit delta